MSHMELVNLYIERDNNMNLNNLDTIKQHLIKLGYYNLNAIKLVNDYIMNTYINNIRNLKNISYNDYKLEFMKTKEYENHMQNISRDVGRAVILSSISDIGEFYKKCTLDELNYLGY